MITLEEKAKAARKKVLELIYKAQTSHIGSNFSVIDIFTVLFDKADLSKDKIILSAGWKAASFYYFLAEKGLISKEELDTYCQPGSRLIGLTEPGVPGVHFAGGSMGMGLPAAVGFALSKKMKGEEGKVYCVMSDGELAIGTTWEAALIAAHHNLDNLVVIVDCNGLQAMGETKEILDYYWFPGVNPDHYDYGHDFNIIEGCFDAAESLSGNKKPKLIMFETTKGKGVSFMENNNLFHYKNLSDEEFSKALTELK